MSIFDSLGNAGKQMGAKAAAKMVRPYVPAILTTIFEQIALHAGASEGDTVSVRWFKAERGDGTATLMAEVARINELGDIIETIGTIDVLRAADEVPLDKFLDA